MNPQEHTAAALDFLDLADSSIAQQNLLLRSELLWCAAAHAVKAVAKRRGWQNRSHADLFDVTERLSVSIHVRIELAHDHSFCAELVRRLRVAPRRSLDSDYSAHLQEVTAPGFGRRDIVIQDGGMRIVLEAKIGDAEPTANQLLMYGAEDNLWNQYKTRGVVALTQVELSAATREEVRAKLSENSIQFDNV